MKIYKALLLALFFSHAYAEEYPALALNEDEHIHFSDDPMLWGEEEQLYSATRYVKRLNEAPAIATVISEEQIKNIGANTLADILRIVPGLSVEISRSYGKKYIEVRGAKNAEGDLVLIQIDNHNLNHIATGSAAWHFVDFPVEHIKRVEVIRGPGSALYGANAGVAVINIVTKTGLDEKDTQVTLGGGSYHSRHVNLMNSNEAGDWNYIATIDHNYHDDTDTFIPSDGIGASGIAADQKQRDVMQLRAHNGGLSVNALYSNDDQGDYVGGNAAISDESYIKAKQQFLVLSYDTGLSENTHLRLSAGYDQFNYHARYELLPENISPAFPDGMMASIANQDINRNLEAQLDVFFSNEHTLTFGLEHLYKRVNKMTTKTNYDPVSFAPLDSYQNITSWGSANKGGSRTINAAYLQDSIKPFSSVEMTLGLRHDHYSDFGDTTHPRFGVVWKLARETNIKALYGTAFKAPNTQELYMTNNPAIQGNPELEPTQVKTLEVSLNHQNGKHFTGTASYFWTKVTDVINVIDDQFHNAGTQKMSGLELEYRVGLMDSHHLYGNYTYTQTHDEDTDAEIEGVAAHKGNLGLNLALGRQWHFNTNVFYMGERPRAADDVRDELEPYTLVDMNLRFNTRDDSKSLRLSAHNLTDEHYVSTDPSAKLLEDYPHPGIGYTLEGSIKF